MNLQKGQKVRIKDTFDSEPYQNLIGKIGIYIRMAGTSDALYPYRVSFPDLSKEEGYPGMRDGEVGYIFREDELEPINDKELI